MKKFKFKTVSKTILADTITPVSMYLQVRDVYPHSLLLESSDYHGHENSYSFICIKPLATFEVDNWLVTEHHPDKSVHKSKVESIKGFRDCFKQFVDKFEVSDYQTINGIYGYASYDAVQYFETIRLHATVKNDYNIPDLKYSFYKYIIAVNHFKNDLIIIENLMGKEESEIHVIEAIISGAAKSTGDFDILDKEASNITDDEYMHMVTKGKEHCYRGDVFQIVLSRQFRQKFRGDDFNVYRALRSINPSPYLFYFDYGNFRIFGSSPEAQLKIQDERAIINPIAGTFRRTGNDEKDKQLASELSKDPKENAEHVMLVDLARNDLSRQGKDVRVENYREIQFYSHVIHMVSTVSGKLNEPDRVIDMMMATFPAGTLSGAPKYKAMELIDAYENQNRGYYGGAIGFIDLKGNLNHAIMIRTFLSKNNTLFYQAGAGIVADSVEKNELQEVNNKLGALKKAITMAKNL